MKLPMYGSRRLKTFFLSVVLCFCWTVWSAASSIKTGGLTLVEDRYPESSGALFVRKAAALSRFDDSLSATDNMGETRSIGMIMQEIDKLENEYLDRLADTRSSYGLFGVGSYSHDTLNTETRYVAGLEWRIFNDGYFEAVRRDSQKILQTQLEFYQMRQDMIARRLDEDLFNLTAVENRVNLAHNQEKAAILEKLVEKRRRQLEQGYTTRLDVFNLERQLREADDNAAYYRGTKLAGVDSKQRELLNDLENIRLKPVDHLKGLAEAHSSQLKIQDNFIARSDSFPTWIDDFSINLEAGYTHEYYDRDRNTVGVEIEMPLSFNTDRASLVATQKRIYRYQQEAVARRLHQQVESLSSFYNFQQQRLLAQQDALLMVLEMRQDNQRKEERSLQKFEDDPARNLELLEVQLIDARFEALLTRLKLYESILKLFALIQGPEITALFEFD